MQPPDPPHRLTHLFTRTVDAAPVHFVRPADTDRPTWAAYEGTHYLGTIHAQFDTGGRWHVQSLREHHLRLDDAIRALRRPTTWHTEREQARRWAHALLNDPRLLVIDVQTTGLHQAWAVQIGITDRYGTTVFDELINPLADITPAAAALHGITTEAISSAPTFSTLLPALALILDGRRPLAYNAPFDQQILDRELRRHHGPAAAARPQLTTCAWEDAMQPYAAWKGLWSARHHTYRYQPLGSCYDAIANCRRLLDAIQQIANARTPATEHPRQSTRGAG